MDENEKRLRESMLQEITEVLRCKWADCEVMQFGSYPAGLSVFVSDIDISILGLGVDEIDNKVDNNENHLSISQDKSTDDNNNIDYDENIYESDEEAEHNKNNSNREVIEVLGSESDCNN